eukprot:403367726
MNVSASNTLAPIQFSQPQNHQQVSSNTKMLMRLKKNYIDNVKSFYLRIFEQNEDLNLSQQQKQQIPLLLRTIKSQKSNNQLNFNPSLENKSLNLDLSSQLENSVNQLVRGDEGGMRSFVQQTKGGNLIKIKTKSRNTNIYKPPLGKTQQIFATANTNNFTLNSSNLLSENSPSKSIFKSHAILLPDDDKKKNQVSLIKQIKINPKLYSQRDQNEQLIDLDSQSEDHMSYLNHSIQQKGKL